MQSDITNLQVSVLHQRYFQLLLSDFHDPAVKPIIHLCSIGFSSSNSNVLVKTMNKILKFDWLSTVLISALIGQCTCNRTVRAIAHALLGGFFHC